MKAVLLLEKVDTLLSTAAMPSELAVVSLIMFPGEQRNTHDLPRLHCLAVRTVLLTAAGADFRAVDTTHDLPRLYRDCAA